MKLKRILSIGIISLGSNSSFAEDPYVDFHDTMCIEGESIYISCTLYSPPKKTKTASICAKGNTSPNSGYIQYRYGIPGKTVELKFPEKTATPKGEFKLYESNNPHGINHALRFTKGAYTYSFEKTGLSSYQLVVRKNGKEIFNRTCEEPGKTYITDEAYIGVQTVNLESNEISSSEK